LPNLQNYENRKFETAYRVKCKPELHLQTVANVATCNIYRQRQNPQFGEFAKLPLWQICGQPETLERQEAP